MRVPRSVLHLVHRWEAGGVMRHILDLSGGLRAKGVRVRVAGWTAGGEDADAALLALPLFAKDGKRKSAAGFFRSRDLLRRVLRDEQIDVLHMHSRYATPLGALAVRGLPVARVYTAHSAFRDLGLLPWYPKHIICPGEAVRAAFRESVRGAAQHTLHLVPHGVRMTDAVPPADEATGVPLFLFLGRFAPSKGGDVLIDALALLARKGNREWRAAFVGDGPEMDAWQLRVRAHGLHDIVRFEPWTPDPSPWLHDAAALVLPSESLEGLPMAMLEAMAAGCPVIASDLPSFVGEIINGNTGLLFQNKNTAQLAARLAFALEAPARMREMADTARAAVQRGHPMERMTEGTLAVYRQALADEE
jgi:glycosyltransferase involved in cell wall biosynthesis